MQTQTAEHENATNGTATGTRQTQISGEGGGSTPTSKRSMEHVTDLTQVSTERRGDVSFEGFLGFR